KTARIPPLTTMREPAPPAASGDRLQAAVVAAGELSPFDDAGVGLEEVLLGPRVVARVELLHALARPDVEVVESAQSQRLPERMELVAERGRLDFALHALAEYSPVHVRADVDRHVPLELHDRGIGERIHLQRARH